VSLSGVLRHLKLRRGPIDYRRTTNLKSRRKYFLMSSGKSPIESLSLRYDRNYTNGLPLTSAFSTNLQTLKIVSDGMKAIEMVLTTLSSLECIFYIDKDHRHTYHPVIIFDKIASTTIFLTNSQTHRRKSSIGNLLSQSQSYPISRQPNDVDRRHRHAFLSPFQRDLL